MTDNAEIRTGSCLCGQVSFKLIGEPRPIMFCHCEQCRRTSGHYVAASAVRSEQLVLKEKSGLHWYRSSESAQRGFCRCCGSSLFWKPDHDRFISVMAGTIDAPTGIPPHQHIFVADASDYYAVDDNLPQQAQYDNPVDPIADT